MRISDWSSDVCSSDLAAKLVALFQPSAERAASMSLDPETRHLLKYWGLRIAGTAYLLFVVAFMVGHPQAGSMASLSYALAMAVVPAAVAAAEVLGVMLILRRR